MILFNLINSLSPHLFFLSLLTSRIIIPYILLNYFKIIFEILQLYFSFLSPILIIFLIKHFHFLNFIRFFDYLTTNI